MDVRLILPVLLLAAALSLAGGVDAALTPREGSFLLEPGGPAGGAWTALTMAGRYGSSPELLWRCPSVPLVKEFSIIAEDLDAPDDEAVFWIAWGIPPSARRLEPGLGREASRGQVLQGTVFDGRPGYAAPGAEASLRHRLRFTLIALREPLRLPPGAPASIVATAARTQAISETSWMVGGGW